ERERERERAPALSAGARRSVAVNSACGDLFCKQGTAHPAAAALKRTAGSHLALRLCVLCPFLLPSIFPSTLSSHFVSFYLSFSIHTVSPFLPLSLSSVVRSEERR